MLWLILFPALLIGIVIAWAIADYRNEKRKDPYSPWWNGPEYFGAGMLLGFVGFILGVLANILTSIWFGTHVAPVKVQNLQAIASSTSTSGSFFLGSGTIDQKQVFAYFVDRGNGFYTRAWVDASDAVIKEDDSTPRLVTYQVKDDNFWLHIGVGSGIETYVFFVPRGSVVQDYTLHP